MKLADELRALDARLRSVPTQDECSAAVNDLLRFMDKNAPAILAALSTDRAPADVEGLVEKLREGANLGQIPASNLGDFGIFDEAADTILSLQAEVSRLAAALRDIACDPRAPSTVKDIARAVLTEPTSKYGHGSAGTESAE